MQYEITLPADYEMGIIRNRVTTKGALTDDFEGLGLKAYLVQDRANGAEVNQYAPFYLWNSTTGMSRFLWGGQFFSGICQSFGRLRMREHCIVIYPERLLHRRYFRAVAKQKTLTGSLLFGHEDVGSAMRIQAQIGDLNLHP